MPGRPKGLPKTGGRKKGSTNKATASREAEVRASGLTPLDFMLTMLRDVAQTLDNRMWAAEKAAPYVHPKLANVEHSGGLDVTTQTKEQRDAAVAAATRANG
jgi:hypothetical protein